MSETFGSWTLLVLGATCWLCAGFAGLVSQAWTNGVLSTVRGCGRQPARYSEPYRTHGVIRRLLVIIAPHGTSLGSLAVSIVPSSKIVKYSCRLPA